MQTYMKWRLVTAVMLTGLLTTTLIGAHSAAAQPAQQGADLVSKVQAAVAAFNAGDKATLTALFDPAFQDVVTNWPANTPSSLTGPNGLNALLTLAGKGERVTLANCTQPGGDTVHYDATLAGGILPQLPHPFTETAVFRFTTGKIVREEETLSATTASDLSALFASFAAGGAAQPAGQTDLLSVMQQLVTALNAGDTATLGTLYDPSYQGVFTNMPPNAPPQVSQPRNRDRDLQIAGQRQVQVTAFNCSQTSANTVRCDIGESGGLGAGLPHPYKETALLTFANGKLVRNEETLSETTRNDLAQVFAQLQQQQPGMPTTGRPDGAPGSGLLFLLLACGGLLFAAGGAFLRRRGDSRY